MTTSTVSSIDTAATSPAATKAAATNGDVLADIVSIPVTPFTGRDGDELDLPAYAAVLDRLVAGGVKVLTVNGNTGEFFTLSPAERLRLIEVSGDWTDRAVVMVGIGHDIASAVVDGRAAARAGATHVMVHQPAHPHQSKQGWIDYHTRIAAGLPELGVVLYLRAPWVEASMVSELVRRAPNVVAIKCALPDVDQFALLRAGVDAPITWIAGLAEPYALSYAAHGAVGFTSGLVNVCPGISIAIRDALREQRYDTAISLLDRIQRFEQLRAADRSGDNVAVVKEALGQLGVCAPTLRPPASRVTPAVAREITTILTDWVRDFPVPGFRDGAQA